MNNLDENDKCYVLLFYMVCCPCCIPYILLTLFVQRTNTRTNVRTNLENVPPETFIMDFTNCQSKLIEPDTIMSDLDNFSNDINHVALAYPINKRDNYIFVMDIVDEIIEKIF